MMLKSALMGAALGMSLGAAAKTVPIVQDHLDMLRNMPSSMM